MLGKFKGFSVPGKDKFLFDTDTPTIERRFCYGSREVDCKKLTCDECLFNPRADKIQKEAFEIWFLAKGKVTYA